MIGTIDISPSYEFYATEYHGHMDIDTFEEALPDALVEVEGRIWPKADIESSLISCKMAVCAVAELLGDPNKRVTSYTVGRVSETRTLPFSMTSEAAIKRYLGHTHILRGGQWL